MYADKITRSYAAKNIRDRRRKIQEKHNTKHGITPQPIIKKLNSEIQNSLNPYSVTKKNTPITNDMDKKQISKMIKLTKKEMERAATNLNFIEAAKLRDELIELEKLKNKN